MSFFNVNNSGQFFSEEFPQGVTEPITVEDFRSSFGQNVTPSNSIPIVAATATSSNIFSTGNFPPVAAPAPVVIPAPAPAAVAVPQFVEPELIGTNVNTNVSADVLQTGLIVAPTQALTNDGLTTSANLDFSPLAAVGQISGSLAGNTSGGFDAFNSAKAFFQKNQSLVIGGALILGVGFISARVR